VHDVPCIGQVLHFAGELIALRRQDASAAALPPQ